jgi:hypothetical protein
MVGIRNEHFPLLVLISPTDKGWEKFIFGEQDLFNELKVPKVTEFLTHYKQGTLRKHLRTEDDKIEIILNQTVHVIKGHRSLSAFINLEDKDVVVLFYAHYCHHC